MTTTLPLDVLKLINVSLVVLLRTPPLPWLQVKEHTVRNFHHISNLCQGEPYAAAARSSSFMQAGKSWNLMSFCKGAAPEKAHKLNNWVQQLVWMHCTLCSSRTMRSCVMVDRMCITLWNGLINHDNVRLIHKLLCVFVSMLTRKRMCSCLTLLHACMYT